MRYTPFGKETKARLKSAPSLFQFDQINHNIEPYFALSPATFAARVDKLATGLDFSFNIVITNGTLTLGGERATRGRAQDIGALVEPFAQWLPDLQMYASDHDKGNIILGQDQYDAALELASEGSCERVVSHIVSYSLSTSLDFTSSQLKHYENLNRNSLPKLKSACHPYSNAVLGPPANANSSAQRPTHDAVVKLTSRCSTHISCRSTLVHELLLRSVPNETSRQLGV
jgi:hypothetical protein